MEQRPVRDVPLWLMIGLVILLLTQAVWHRSVTPGDQAWVQLPEPPSIDVLKLSSLGESTAFARLLALWLQGFDVQQGSKVRYAQLDYVRLEGWLNAILALDPRGQYPLMAASRIYTYVPDEDRIRRMLSLVFQQFSIDPVRRWPWLAHAAILARHRLGDQDLALKYSTALSDISSEEPIPSWARQMRIFILQDLGEREVAALALRALLDSETVTDPIERRYLENELRSLQKPL